MLELLAAPGATQSVGYQSTSGRSASSGAHASRYAAAASAPANRMSWLCACTIVAPASKQRERVGPDLVGRQRHVRVARLGGATVDGRFDEDGFGRGSGMPRSSRGQALRASTTSPADVDDRASTTPSTKVTRRVRTAGTARAGHDHADEVERVGGVDGDALAVAR